jgi:NADH:ubiquinone oxidoreductase subunit 2 (subunit N)
VTLLPFLALCLITAVVSLLALRRGPGFGRAIATIGLSGAAVAAVALPAGPTTLGGAAVAVDGYLRLVLASGCVLAVGMTLLGAVVDARRRAAGRDGFPVAAVPLAASVTLGTGALALAMAPVDAALPAALAGVAALIGLLALPRDDTNPAIGRQILRVVALAGGAVIAGAAVLLGTAPALSAEPLAIGGATIVLAGAVVARIGAIPFHAPIARLIPRAGLVAPFLLVWATIPLVVTAVGIVAAGISPLALPLGPERAIIAAVAAVTLLVAPFVAAMTDDLDHVVAYSIVADMGLVVLAFAAAVPAWESIRTWLLIVAVSKTAFVAWSVAMRETYGSVRLSDLHGWVIRAPLLAAGLALVTVASLGAPTLAVAAVRRDIADAAFGEPFASAFFVAGLLAVLPYLRLAAVGLSTPGALVRRAPDERLRRPAAWVERARSAAFPDPRGAAGPESRPDAGRGLADTIRRDPAADRAAARVADIARQFAIGARRGTIPDAERGSTAPPVPRAARAPRAPRRPIGSRLAPLRAEIGEAWRLNLVPIAAGLVLALAALALAVSAGSFDLRAGAAERHPGPVASEPGRSVSPAP